MGGNSVKKTVFVDFRRVSLHSILNVDRLLAMDGLPQTKQFLDTQPFKGALIPLLPGWEEDFDETGDATGLYRYYETKSDGTRILPHTRETSVRPIRKAQKRLRKQTYKNVVSTFEKTGKFIPLRSEYHNGIPVIDSTTDEPAFNSEGMTFTPVPKTELPY